MKKLIDWHKEGVTMAKKKEESTVKDTAKTTKSTAKASTKKTTVKAKPEAKVTKIKNAEPDKEAPVTTEEKQDPEKSMALSCQKMMSSIIEWSLDSLMYSNILLISKKMNISMEEAGAILDVNAIDLARLSLVYAAYSKTPEAEKAAVLGKYSGRIKAVEPEEKAGESKKSTNKK